MRSLRRTRFSTRSQRQRSEMSSSLLLLHQVTQSPETYHSEKYGVSNPVCFSDSSFRPVKFVNCNGAISFLLFLYETVSFSDSDRRFDSSRKRRSSAIRLPRQTRL